MVSNIQNFAVTHIRSNLLQVKSKLVSDIPVAMVGLPRSSAIHELVSDSLVDAHMPPLSIVSLLPSTANEPDIDWSTRREYEVELCKIGLPRATFTFRFAKHSTNKINSYSSVIKKT